jgi:hypothetical protein
LYEAKQQQQQQQQQLEHNAGKRRGIRESATRRHHTNPCAEVAHVASSLANRKQRLGAQMQ